MPQPNSPTPPTVPSSSAPRVATAKPMPEALKNVTFDMPDDIASTIESGKPEVTDGQPKRVDAPVVPAPTKEPVVPPATKKEVVATEPEPEGTPLIAPPKKKDDKPVAPPVVKDDKTPATDGDDKLIKPPSASTRNYDGFSPDEVTVLKNMSVQSYEFTSKLIKEARQLETQLKEASYLSNPSAYVLTPEYQQATNVVGLAQRESQYWQSQLMLIKQGKPWKPITGWTQTGEPIVGAEQQPTDTNEEEVRLYVNQCLQAGQQAQQQAMNIQNGFTNRVKQDTLAIESERARRFGWAKDKAMLDEVIVVDGMGEKKIKDAIADFESMFPAYHRSSPVMKIAADLFVSLQIYAMRLKDAERNNAITETKRQEAVRGEPKGEQPPVDNKPNKYGVKMFSMEGLPS